MKKFKNPIFLALFREVTSMKIVLSALFIMATMLNLEASQSPQETKCAQEFERVIEKDARVILEKKLSAIKAEAEQLPPGAERNYWRELLDAHEKRDIARLEKLQQATEKPQGIKPVQVKIQFLILSALDRQESERITERGPSEPITLPSMNTVRRTSLINRVRDLVEHIPGLNNSIFV